MPKQISMVLEAVEAGDWNSDQISAITGLSIKTVSAYLSQLAASGLIVREHLDAYRDKPPGRAFHIYRPLTPTNP